MKPKNVYLDYAAATPLDPAVLEAMQPYLTDNFYNPSSLYRAARQVKTDLESARAKIALVLGAHPSEVIFTGGATESVNLALQGVAKAHPKGRIVCTATEHHAVLNTVAALAAWRGGEIVQVKPDGSVDLEALKKAVDDRTVLISIGYANNETGAIQPMKKIAQLVAQIRSERIKQGNRLPLLWHTDASAAANHLDLSVNRLGVDLLTLGGGKIYGPSDSGILYLRQGVDLEPVIYGGGQEKNKRSGTVNVAAAAGLAEALKLAQNQRHAESKRLEALVGQIAENASRVAGVVTNSPKNRLPNIINLSVSGTDGETLVLYFDRAGFQLSTGAACTIGQAEPSHVLLAMGLTKAQANSSLRITLGRRTKASDIQAFNDAFPKVVRQVRNLVN